MPEEFRPSGAAVELIKSLLVEKEERLSTPRYQHNDWTRKSVGNSRTLFSSDKNIQMDTEHFVHPYDAEDIKNHPWFHAVPWEFLHLLKPPFIPRVKHWEDTKYFDEEESVSDVDSAESDTDAANSVLYNPSHMQKNKLSRSSHHQPEAQHIVPSFAVQPMRCHREDEIAPDENSTLVNSREASPTLISLQPQLGGVHSQRMGGPVEWTKQNFEQELASELHRKRKEKKRARDKILRDPECAAIALRMRKEGAFLEYGYRRSKSVNDIVQEVVGERQMMLSRSEKRDSPGSDSLMDTEGGVKLTA